MWHKLGDNPQAIEQLFNSVPTLSGVAVTELVLQENGAGIKVKIELLEFPDTPPRRWLIDKYNSCDIVLSLYSMQGRPDIKVIQWSNDNRVKISITRNDCGSIHLKADGNSCYFEIVCDGFYFQNIDGYLKDESVL